MKTPTTTTELTTIIQNLNHRERVCFRITKDMQTKFEYAHFIEVYSTILFDSKYQDININIKLVDALGKPLKDLNGKTILNRSKYLRLFTADYLDSIMSIIEHDTIQKQMIEDSSTLSIA